MTNRVAHRSRIPAKRADRLQALRYRASWLIAALALLTGCGADSLPAAAADPGAIAGLRAQDEVVLVPVPPHGSDASFQWTHAYLVGRLPIVNIGRPSPTFVGGFARHGETPITCTGSNGHANCRPVHESRPLVAGERFTGQEVMAWVWVGVPAEAVAVLFTDQTGGEVWQQPIDGVVIFPDTLHEDGDCRCRLDAIDTEGQLIAAVDVPAARFIDL